ncbi:hypothetical protein PTT41_003935 [Cronobacter turicensis]|nr:hypothetical protein [Cronobacter turicensis]
MAIRKDFNFVFNQKGIVGTIVTIGIMERKHWWNQWKSTKVIFAICTGFNAFTGAEWAEDGGQRMDVDMELEINEAAQDAVGRE